MFEGHSAYLLLKHVLTHPESTYTGIDNWAIFERRKDEELTHPEENLKEFSNVEIVTGHSPRVLKKFIKKNRMFDIIYIDGGHKFRNTLLDTTLAWSLSRDIIIWDDYGKILGVKRAVDAFLRNIPSDTYNIIENDYQFGVQKCQTSPLTGQ